MVNTDVGVTLVEHVSVCMGVFVCVCMYETVSVVVDECACENVYLGPWLTLMWVSLWWSM